MKKIFTKVLLGLLLILLFVSCKPKALEINIPEERPKIVVNSFASEGVILLFLTKSFSPLADTADIDFIRSLGIAGADANLIYQNAPIDFVEIPEDSIGTKGVYLAQVENLGSNKKIALEVKADGMNPVSAETYILEGVGMDAEAIRFPFDSAYATIFYSFEDVNTEEHNYYALGISGSKQEDVFKGVDTLRKLTTSKFVLFDDLEYPFDYIDGAINVLAEKNDTLTVSLAHVSKEYYEYLQVFQKGGSFFSSITKEPINYPTNVIGGYGFFNAYLPYVEVLIVEE